MGALDDIKKKKIENSVQGLAEKALVTLTAIQAAMPVIAVVAKGGATVLSSLISIVAKEWTPVADDLHHYKVRRQVMEIEELKRVLSEDSVVILMLAKVLRKKEIWELLQQQLKDYADRAERMSAAFIKNKMEQSDNGNIHR